MASKGSMKAKCQNYKSRKTREKNKITKLKKHLNKNQNDSDAKESLKVTMKLVA